MSAAPTSDQTRTAVGPEFAVVPETSIKTSTPTELVTSRESGPTSAAAAKLRAAQAELQTLQAAVHALRRQLAGQTLRAYLTDVAARGGSDPAKDLAYRQLEETLAQFDQQTAAVTLVAEKLP